MNVGVKGAGVDLSSGTDSGRQGGGHGRARTSAHGPLDYAQCPKVLDAVSSRMILSPVFSSSGSLGKATEKSSKDKDKNSSDLGSKEGADKRKRSRVTDKVLTANSNPSSPSAAKRRRT